MLNNQIEFLTNEETTPVISFRENLNTHSRMIHEKALVRAQRYLIAEADLLESIIEIDKDRTFEKWGLTHLTPYCVQHLGLSEEVAATFVRVARKSLQVPELQTAIAEGKLSVTKAKTISSVLTSDNHETWIEKAQSFSKDKLEREIAHLSPQATKPEKAKASGPNLVRVEFDISAEDMALFRKAQDIVSRKMKKSATLAETQSKLLECFLDKFDPVLKAERAHKKTKKTQAVQKITQFQKATTAQNGPNARETKEVPTDRSRERSNLKKSRTPLKAEILHAVNQRDRGCCQAKLPDGSVCGHKRWIHFHHIVPHMDDQHSSLILKF